MTLTRLRAALGAALLLAFAAVAPSSSQGLRNAPAGFCTASTALSSAIGLSSFTCNYVTGASLSVINYASICVYAQGVVWRDDGVAPTGTQGSGGQGLVPQSSTIPTCMGYNGDFQAIQFIQQTSGALLGVTLYR